VISHRFIAIEARVGVTVIPISRVGEAVRTVRHPVADSIDWVFNVVIVKDIHSAIVAVEFVVYNVTFMVSHLRKAVYARIWVTVFLRSVISVASVATFLCPVAGGFGIPVTDQATIAVKALAVWTLSKLVTAVIVTVFASKFFQLIAASVTSLHVL
jgi:hypothetical protein